MSAAEWKGPPYTFKDGRRPRNCFRDPKTPFWQYEFQIGGIRERGSTGFEDARGAEDFVGARRTQLAASSNKDKLSPVTAALLVGHQNVTGKPEISFSEALATYIEDKGISGREAAGSLYSAKQLLRVIGDKSFHELTHTDFFNFRHKRAKEISRFGRPIAPTTINRDIAFARSVFPHIRDKGFRSPDELPVWPRLFDNHAEKAHARSRELKPNEEAALWEAIAELAPDLAPVVEFALLCGQRRAAVITLERSQIDWVNMEFTILLKTKGAKKRPHTVPLTDRMVEIVRAQPVVQGTDRVFTYACRQRRAAHTDKRGRVRPERVEGRRYPFSLDGWQKDWRLVLAKAGIKDFVFHDLRHTSATRLVRATGNMRVTQQLLGHENIKTTQRYAHADLDDVRNALRVTEEQHKADQDQLHRRRVGLKVVA